MAQTTEKMTLYYYPTFRSVRNIWLIKEMGVDSDFQYKKYNPHESTPEEKATFKKNVHPHGTIPVLLIPGEPPILESGAITLYLADRYGQFVPEPKQRKDYYNFAVYGSLTLDECVSFFFYSWVRNVENPEEKVKMMRDKLNTCLDYLSKRLEGRDYLCGDFTAADCIVGYSIYYLSTLRGGELINNHPKILEYHARLKSRPAYKETIAMT